MYMKSAPLREIATVIAGQSPPGASYNDCGLGLPFFQGKADFGDVYPVARKWCTDARKIAEAGDILISVRAPVGPTNIARERCCIGRGLAAVRPDPSVVLPEFVHWMLIAREEYFIDKAQGSTFFAIGINDLKSIIIPLPRMNEQYRIVNLMKRSRNIELLRRHSLPGFDILVPSLFVKLFGESSGTPTRYGMTTLDEVATVRAGDPAPQNREAFGSTGPLFVRMQDVGRDHVNSALSVSRDRLAPGWLQRNRLRLFPAGSILIPKSGASVNLNHRAMLATDAHVVSHLAVITPDPSRVDPHYLFWWSVGYDPREQVQVTSLPSLKLATLKEATLPLPPLDEQRRFSRVAKRALHITMKIEAAARKAAALRESLMSRLLGNDAEY